MPSKIRVLTDHTINKIAAGEVIENPSSVVKELVENSLDAGANDICVEIKGGGRVLIRITDNGCGMSNDDALLSLERHATSKIREVEDIHDVATLGFRGEAIPSIASISKFMILTCPQQEAPAISTGISQGTMILVDGGKIISCAAAARSPGTTIEVKSLFFNTPVRKKFLKSPTVDTNEILKMISLIALGHPHVKFQLISDNKSMLITPVSSEENFVNKMHARIEAVLGCDYLQNCLSLDCEKEGIRLQGMIGLPSYTRHNRTGQFLFINNRGVFSPLIAHAIKEGYGTSLPSGRHPVFVLHLTISGSLVDVNVHPQKREVRLRQEHILKNLIISQIEKALVGRSFLASENIMPQVSPVFMNAFAQSNSSGSHEDWIFRSKPSAPWTKPEEPLAALNMPPLELGEVPDNLPIHQPLPQHRVICHETEERMQTSFSLEIPRLLSPPSILATIPSYILLDDTGNNEFIAASRSATQPFSGGLFLVDQKAAHMRVIFEKLQENEKGQQLSIQSLLIPYSIEVSAFEASLLRTSLDYLQSIGIHIREFGPHTFLIDAIPQVFGNSNLNMLITDLLQTLREANTHSFLQEERHKRIALTAGRAAISYDRKLTLEEAQSLINQLCSCRYPFQCPQGKAILLQLSPEDLARQFHKQ